MTDQLQITPDSLIAHLDDLNTQLSIIIDQLDLNAPIAQPGDWTPRQVLSHIIGSLNRSPIQAGYFIANVSPVPVTFSDPYWIEVWHSAPAAAFKLALQAAVEGNKALVHSLTADILWRVLPLTGFGEMPLAVFLMVSYQTHLADMHIPQLRAYL